MQLRELHDLDQQITTHISGKHHEWSEVLAREISIDNTMRKMILEESRSFRCARSEIGVITQYFSYASDKGSLRMDSIKEMNVAQCEHTCVFAIVVRHRACGLEKVYP